MRSTLTARTRQLVLTLLLLGASLAAQEVRGVWAPVWEMSTPQAIDLMVQNVAAHNGNLILAEVRYRGDAAYVPNRADSRWPNPEPRCYMIAEGFDPLDYLIERAHEHDITVKAWFTVLVATSNVLDNVSPQHVWYRHNDWITCRTGGRRMSPAETEGAFLDPGVPEVHEYLLNVILDVTANYDIDGVQLDYIRYPGTDYGHHPVSRERWRQRHPRQSPDSWQRWKEEQVTSFVRRCYAEVKALRSDIEVSASVMADIDAARGKFAQDWPTWLREGYIDSAYLMSYQEDDIAFERILNSVDGLGFNNRIVVGLRAWRNHTSYPARRIVSKINILRRHDYAGLCLFSYGGLVNNGYYNTLGRQSMPSPQQYVALRNGEGIVLGVVTGAGGEPVEGATVTLRALDHITTTDANGFFAFFGLDVGAYPVRVLQGDSVLEPPAVTIERPGQAVRLELTLAPVELPEASPGFTLEGFRDSDHAVLYWSQSRWTPLSVYRRTLGGHGHGLFELIDILLDSTGVWVDESVELHRSYEYKLITLQEKASQPLLIPAQGDEQAMRVRFEVDGEDYRIMLHLPLADKLSWSLETEIGEPMLTAEGWYPGGQTVERWNGVTIGGTGVKPGVYRFRCRSLMREWSWDAPVLVPGD
ncbi:MAG: family 10 glycosylhydrolase [Candidatus Cloacimonetes bacterium]|nr:family 10 glycosylhydrolase [Candidatus Cloacimonadota bacterium]